MSSLACETHIVVDGPLPVERVHTLLTVPNVLVAGLEDHWENGVITWGYPEDTPSLWEGGLQGTFRTKLEGGTFPSGTFTSFVLYVPVSCTASGMTPDEFAERAGRVLRITQAFGVEQALAQGVVGLSNPYLGDANLVPLGGGAVSARIAVSHLEDAIAQTGRGGIIHLTPAVLDALQPVRISDDPTAPLYTGAGTPISVGAGYIGTDPVSQASPGTTSDWVFATGPVEVRIDEEVDLPEIGDALDRVMNDVTYRAEKIAVVSWDVALQVGVLADWAL